MPFNLEKCRSLDPSSFKTANGIAEVPPTVHDLARRVSRAVAAQGGEFCPALASFLLDHALLDNAANSGSGLKSSKLQFVGA
jgi:hypothetical protein